MDNHEFLIGEQVKSSHQMVERFGSKPTLFSVSLLSYPFQPWSNAHADVTQWFNYGLNPTTWAAYSLKQLHIYETARKAQMQ